MNDQPAVAAGQVWEEVDPRHPRRVTIVSFSHPWGDGPTFVDGSVRIVSENARRIKRTTSAKLSRFNGKRGGYRFVSEGK